MRNFFRSTLYPIAKFFIFIIALQGVFTASAQAMVRVGDIAFYDARTSDGIQGKATISVDSYDAERKTLKFKYTLALEGHENRNVTNYEAEDLEEMRSYTKELPLILFPPICKKLGGGRVRRVAVPAGKYLACAGTDDSDNEFSMSPFVPFGILKGTTATDWFGDEVVTMTLTGFKRGKR